LAMHEEFRALCAMATSGCLSHEEQRSLETHLAVCDECRQAAEEYEAVAGVAMPSVVPDFPADVSNVPHDWSTKTAKQEFFRRLSERGAHHALERRSSNPSRSDRLPGYEVTVRGRGWHFWPGNVRALLPYAASLAAMVAIGALAYQLGARRSTETLHVNQQKPESEIDAARQEIVAASKEHELLKAQLEDRDRAIAILNGKLAQQLTELQKLKSEDRDLRESAQKAQSDNSETASERDGLSRKLDREQSDVASMQKEMESLRQQRTNDALRVAELEARLGKVPETLKDRDDTIEQQREFLARDRDIRDLMGARDLYIAEVFDVGRDGQTKKPFGRVFYTKGKSLVFYAYDLDQQPGLHDVSTFQAWGRRGPDLAQAANLGIFYTDNTAHKRWVLKSSDVKSLQEIDAVFVTVEPKGGSRKPSGKQLLFAYLHVEPNHP
jgi:anti-sigma factor RsiW